MMLLGSWRGRLSALIIVNLQAYLIYVRYFDFFRGYYARVTSCGRGCILEFWVRWIIAGLEQIMAGSNHQMFDHLRPECSKDRKALATSRKSLHARVVLFRVTRVGVPEEVKFWKHKALGLICTVPVKYTKVEASYFHTNH